MTKKIETLSPLVDAGSITPAQRKEVLSFYPEFTGEEGEEALGLPAVKLGPLLSGKHAYTGYANAAKNPEGIIPAVTEAGLKGRGGANFPTGSKWGMVRDNPAPVKYIICNFSEGEPGTGKDYALALNAPDRIIEGVAVCALATGVKDALLFIRPGYDAARDALQAELVRAEEMGIVNNGRLNLYIMEGAGGYICGEETGLIEAVECHRAEPRLKPPYPGTAGVFGCPTIINNAESFAAAALIMEFGAAAYREKGTEKNPGTRLFTITGAVKNPGVYEMPNGTTVGELMQLAGMESNVRGLMIGGRATGKMAGLSALQLASEPETFASAGLTLGTGSIYAIPAGTDSVEMVRQAVAFLSRESCGKCNPCKYGTKRLGELLKAFAEGDPDVSGDTVRSFAQYIADNAMCGLGQAVTNPVLSAMNAFPEDWERADYGKGECTR